MVLARAFRIAPRGLRLGNRPEKASQARRRNEAVSFFSYRPLSSRSGSRQAAPVFAGFLGMPHCDEFRFRPPPSGAVRSQKNHLHEKHIHDRKIALQLPCHSSATGHKTLFRHVISYARRFLCVNSRELPQNEYGMTQPLHHAERSAAHASANYRFLTPPFFAARRKTNCRFSTPRFFDFPAGFRETFDSATTASESGSSFCVSDGENQGVRTR